MGQNYRSRRALHDRLLDAAQEQGKELTWTTARGMTEYKLDGAGPLTPGVVATKLDVRLSGFAATPTYSEAVERRPELS